MSIEYSVVCVCVYRNQNCSESIEKFQLTYDYIEQDITSIRILE